MFELKLKSANVSWEVCVTIEKSLMIEVRHKCVPAEPIVDKSKETDTHSRTTGHPEYKLGDPNMWTSIQVYLVKRKLVSVSQQRSRRGVLWHRQFPHTRAPRLARYRYRPCCLLVRGWR